MTHHIALQTFKCTQHTSAGPGCTHNLVLVVTPVHRTLSFWQSPPYTALSFWQSSPPYITHPRSGSQSPPFHRILVLAVTPVHRILVLAVTPVHRTLALAVTPVHCTLSFCRRREKAIESMKQAAKVGQAG